MDTDRGQMVPESCHQGWSSIRMSWSRADQLMPVCQAQPMQSRGSSFWRPLRSTDGESVCSLRARPRIESGDYIKDKGSSG